MEPHVDRRLTTDLPRELGAAIRNILNMNQNL